MNSEQFWSPIETDWLLYYRDTMGNGILGQHSNQMQLRLKNDTFWYCPSPCRHLLNVRVIPLFRKIGDPPFLHPEIQEGWDFSRARVSSNRISLTKKGRSKRKSPPSLASVCDQQLIPCHVDLISSRLWPWSHNAPLLVFTDSRHTLSYRPQEFVETISITCALRFVPLDMIGRVSLASRLAILWMLETSRVQRQNFFRCSRWSDPVSYAWYANNSSSFSIFEACQILLGSLDLVLIRPSPYSLHQADLRACPS